MNRLSRFYIVLFLMLLLWHHGTSAENGYNLWLRYVKIADPALIDNYKDKNRHIVFPAVSDRLKAAKGKPISSLFKLPKKVGVFEDKEMTVAIGRFGPYIRHNSAFYSLPKGVDPLDVTEEECIQIIQEKRQKDIEKVIRVFDENPDAQIEQGRWGPFIRFGKQNLKIPKGTEIEKISYEDVLKWAEADAPKGKTVKAKTAEKKTVAKKAPAKKAPAKKTTKSK